MSNQPHLVQNLLELTFKIEYVEPRKHEKDTAKLSVQYTHPDLSHGPVCCIHSDDQLYDIIKKAIDMCTRSKSFVYAPVMLDTKVITFIDDTFSRLDDDKLYIDRDILDTRIKKNTTLLIKPYTIYEALNRLLT